MTPSREETRLLLQRRLQKAQNDPSGLSEAAAFYGALMDTLIDAEAEIELPSLSAEQIAAKLTQGQPILHGEALGFDADAVKATLLKLCDVTEQFILRHAQDALNLKSEGNKRSFWSLFKKDDKTSERMASDDATAVRAIAAARISEVLQNGQLDYDVLLEKLTTGSDDELTQLAQAARVDASLLTTLARFAMRPTLMAYADAYVETIAANNDAWKRGTCPVCGGAPVLSEYHDQDQSRSLRCAACGAAWFFRRVSCALCHNDNFRLLGYFTLDGYTAGRVDTCDACHGYLKGTNVLDATPSLLLPLEDLLMLSLDAAAEQKGYTRKQGNR
jgi:hypothetical protein